MIKNNNLILSIGIVKNNSDPVQNGRLQIFIPAKDSYSTLTEDLPWALYVTPFGGSTADYKAGREQNTINGVSTYGWWAIPKNGSQVLVGYLEGDPHKRFWMGGVFQPELNRTLPHSIDGLKSEIDESGVYPQMEMDFLKESLEEAGLGPNDPNWKTVGGYERSVSYPANKTIDKPTDNGYAQKPLSKEDADSQMCSFTTPGRHYMLFSDIDEYCRIRFRTTAGNQVIFDDTNERIYISTAKGRNWFELDEGSGHVNVYSASKINIHGENDVNIHSDENINLVAKKRVNIQSLERGIKLQSEMGINLNSSASNIKLTASRDIHLKTTNGASSGGIGSNSTCNIPPYSGGPLGLTRDYEEEAGSSTSRILINSVENIEIRSDSQSVEMTAAQKIDLFARGADLTIESGNNLNLKAAAIPTFAGGIGLLTVDSESEEGSLWPIISKQDFGGSATIASEASSVKSEDIVSNMVIPEHESWARDTDESECETPRNKNYKG